MNPELWRRVEELFHAAARLSPDARAAFLEKACGEDVDLKRQVELLLSNDEHAGSLLEKPILADVIPRQENEDGSLRPDPLNHASADTPPSPIGTRVWNYEVVSLLGAGGIVTSCSTLRSTASSCRFRFALRTAIQSKPEHPLRCSPPILAARCKPRTLSFTSYRLTASSS